MDEPRFLTFDEIESLLSKIEPPQIAITEIRNSVYSEIRSMYSYQLSIIKLRPSKISKMGDYIANKSQRSFLEPGMPAGFNAAESITQPATQLVLDTFHSAGQAGKSGFDRLIRNIELSSSTNRVKVYSMQVHMNDKDMTFEDMYFKSHKFVFISIEDLLDNTRLIKESYPFEDMSIYTDDFKKVNAYEDYGYSIRLRFSREKLFLHRITLETLGLELMRRYGDQFSIFVGPQYEAIIDVYPRPAAVNNEIESDFVENCKIYENGAFKEILNKKLGDYPNISQASVMKLKVTDVIQDVTSHYIVSEVDMTESISENLVRVWIDWVVVKKHGIPEEKLERLLELTGHNIVNDDPAGNYYVVESPDLDIKKRINDALDKEDKDLIERFKETGRLQSTDLYIAGFYNIISTLGSDLANIRLDPEVDEFNTISDHVMQIYSVLGIEVARSFIEKEIYDTFEADSKIIAPRNISILVDWMTSNIRPNSVQTKNIPKAEASVIRGMCFEQPTNYLMKGAALGTTEYLSNVSARIVFGAKQKLGTGAFTLEEDPDVYEEYSRASVKPKRSPAAAAVKTPATTDVSPDLMAPDEDLFGDDDGEDLGRGDTFEFDL